jgi:hypothetical protein
MQNLKSKKGGNPSVTEVVRCKIPATEIKVSNHALNRYKQRILQRDISDEELRQIIREQVANGVEVEHKSPADAVKALMSHNYERATYYRKSGVVYVLSKDNTVLTVHRGEAQKWRPVTN